MSALLSFPTILERACRDRAITQDQMATFRVAYSEVSAILVLDPVILPTSNNSRAAPLAMLKDAFPAMAWNQPRGQERAMVMTQKYLTPDFAEELAALMGCVARSAELPADEFLDDARQAPPLYFETEDRGYKGICCVCFKKGAL